MGVGLMNDDDGRSSSAASDAAPLICARSRHGREGFDRMNELVLREDLISGGVGCPSRGLNDPAAGGTKLGGG